MEYRINIFSLVLIAGIAASSIFIGRSSFKPGSGIITRDFKTNKQAIPTCVGPINSGKAISFKKYFPDLFFELEEYPVKPDHIFGVLQEYFPQFIFLKNTFYHHITINGP